VTLTSHSVLSYALRQDSSTSHEERFTLSIYNPVQNAESGFAVTHRRVMNWLLAQFAIMAMGVVGFWFSFGGRTYFG